MAGLLVLSTPATPLGRAGVAAQRRAGTVGRPGRQASYDAGMRVDPPAMRIADLIEIDPLPPMVQLGEAAALRARLHREGGRPDGPALRALRAWVGSYILDGGGNQAALTSILRTLCRRDAAGAAYLVRGMPGSGKTHLLGLLALLAEAGLRPELQPAWEALLEANPGAAPLRGLRLPRLLVVPVDLAAYRGQREELEDAVFACTEQELKQSWHGVDVPLSDRSYALEVVDRHVAPRYAEELNALVAQRQGEASSWPALRASDPDAALALARQVMREAEYPLDFRRSRVERLARLLDITREQQLDGVLWLIDDLSPFLASSDAKGLATDCQFLHFLGQRTKIAPVWAVGMLDAALHEMPELEAHLLAQIRGAFDTEHVLSTEHMRTVCALRVVRKRDPAAFEVETTGLAAAYRRRYAETEVTAGELALSYPLHPLAARCLHGTGERTLGDLRALPSFLAATLGSAAPGGAASAAADALLGPDRVYDVLAPQIAALPRMSAYVHDVVDYFDREAARVATEEQGLVRRLARALVALRLANIPATVRSLADALFPVCEAPELPVERVAACLEAMRLRGDFVDTRTGEQGDDAVYVIAARPNVTEAARRRVGAAKAIVDYGQATFEGALQVCTDPSFPLASLLPETATLDVVAHNTVRALIVEVTHLERLALSTLQDQRALLGDIGTVEDLALYVATPHDPAAQRQRWTQLLQQLGEGRWSGALLAWVPRALTDAEADVLRTLAACEELLGEDAGGDAEGTAMREHLVEEAEGLRAQVRVTLHAAYYQGEVRGARGVLLGAVALEPLRGDWSATMGAIADRALQFVFPELEALAPRRRITDPAEVDLLVEEFVRKGQIKPDADPALLSLVEQVCEPLGIAARDDGQHRVRTGNVPVVSAVMGVIRQRDPGPETAIGRPITCADLAMRMAKSDFGLPGELFELVLAAMLKRGHLVAVDEAGRPIPFARVATPLRENLEHVARAPLVSWEEWQGLGRISRAVLDVGVVSPSHPAQEQLWQDLVLARRGYEREAAELRRQIAVVASRLGHTADAWERPLATLEQLDAFFAGVDDSLPAAAGLSNLLLRSASFLDTTSGPMRLRTLLNQARQLIEFFDEDAEAVLRVHDYINDPRLGLEGHPELERLRERVRLLLADSRQMIGSQLPLVRTAQSFLAAYSRAYLAWHAGAYRPTLFEPYQSIRESLEYQALQRLARVNVELGSTEQQALDLVGRELSKRCPGTELPAALEQQPVCPQCGVLLSEHVELAPPQEVREHIAAAIAERLRRITGPDLEGAVRRYLAGSRPPKAVAERLTRALATGAQLNPREVLNVWAEDVVTHVNRALGGKALRARELDALRRALADRTLTKQEVRGIFEQWLAAGEAPGDDDLIIVE